MRPHRTHHDMTRHTHAWANIPTLAQIQNHLAAHPDSRHLIFCLPANHVIPQWQPENGQQQPLAQAWQEATRCLAHDAVNYIRQWQPETDLWLLPPHAASHLHEHFPQPEHIIWHTPPIAQQPAPPLQAWQQPPTRQPETDTTAPLHVIIIGAGIAGAATAHECATRGARVTVLEAHAHAQAASGNQQGLLYAKISPHLTAQTELLLAGYGYTRRLLQRLLPQQQSWGASGVLHLNHNPSETQRNAQLAQNQHYQHLYRPVSPSQASQIAGIPIAQSALYWQHGAWLNPPALIHALLPQHHPPPPHQSPKHPPQQQPMARPHPQRHLFRQPYRLLHRRRQRPHPHYPTLPLPNHPRANQHRPRHPRQPETQNRPIRRLLHLPRMARRTLLRRHLRPQQPQPRLARRRRSQQPPSPRPAFPLSRPRIRRLLRRPSHSAA